MAAARAASVPALTETRWRCGRQLKPPARTTHLGPFATVVAGAASVDERPGVRLLEAIPHPDPRRRPSARRRVPPRINLVADQRPGRPRLAGRAVGVKSPPNPIISQ